MSMRMIINIIDVTHNTTKKCIGALDIYVYAWLYRNYMAEGKTSILLSDVSIEGKLVEKDKIIIDAKVNGDITAEEIETHSNSIIKGNIKSQIASLSGKLEGNVSSDRIDIKKTANIEGVLNQKTLSIEEGARLKIKTETYK
jgi:cytoskeletal protein CcmA (bactofilin family)